MSDETRDVEALSSIFLDAWRTATAEETNLEWATRVTRIILTSDWLAEHDARVRTEERERIARAIEAKYLGADFGRQYDGRESPDAALHHAYDEGLQTAAEVAREGGADRG